MFDRPIQSDSSTRATKGVKTLLGNPKQAIIKLSLPMILAMSVQTIYNFVDALWVSGFGSNWFSSDIIPEVGPSGLAAVGFVLPFYMIIISISTGIGIGGSSAISRKIGANDKEGADNIAIHTIIITIISSIIFTLFLYYFTEDLLKAIGAGDTLIIATSYGRIIFAGISVIFFANVSNAILRGEGDTKRPMYAMILGAILNIILDPLFIYSLKLGVAGAAYATILSMLVSTIILFYWLFFRGDTYVSFNFNDFKFNKDTLMDIFKVGIPASIQQLSMSITMLIIIIIIKISVDNEFGVGIYNTGWRITTIAILPLLGLSTGLTSVTGAAFGGREYKKLNISFMYSIKIGLIIEIIIAFLVFVLSPFIAALFTTTPEGKLIENDLILFLQITVLFFPTAALGISSSALFQGTGKGSYALFTTIFRTMILTVFFALLFTFFYNGGLAGIWWAIVLANFIGSFIAFIWCKIYINRLVSKNVK